MKKNLKKTSSIQPEIVQKTSPLQTTDVLQSYISQISKYPLLTREEEQKWSRLYHEKKDRQALRILVQSNLRFVVKIASEYSKFSSRLIDLIQEGNMGLLKALNEFNPYKGVRLITYAVWWIRGAIQEYLMKQHSIVRIGTTPAQKKLFYRLRKEALPALNSAENTRLISSELGVSEKEAWLMKERLTQSDLRWDTATASQERFLESEKKSLDLETHYGEKQEISLLKKAIRKLKKQLNRKETFILDSRILSESPKTLQEIGKEFNITREAVRQIESRLLKKIKKEVSQHIGES